MGKTLTIRLPESQDLALTRRAKAVGRTRSALVRELIEHGLQERPVGERIGHLKGRLTLPRAGKTWRRQIKDRNWR
jgi:hypothetical protein